MPKRVALAVAIATKSAVAPSLSRRIAELLSIAGHAACTAPANRKAHLSIGIAGKFYLGGILGDPVAAGVTEVFGNLAATTLNNGGTLTSGATSCTVTSGASPFPQTGNFRILIDSEIMLVTANSANVFTITRGQEGTSAASHADGSAVTHILTKGALQALQQTRPVYTNTASATYTMDSTGNPFDVLILHNKSGSVSYVMPAPTAGRHIEVYDVTGAINTLANNVFFVPNGSEKFNTSAGYTLTGGATFNFTHGSGTVTATSSQFKEELAVGMSIQSSNQSGVNYIITAIASDTSLTVTPTFGGSTTTTATATRTSLTFAANNGKLYFDSDGTDWYAVGDGTPTILKYTASSGAGTNVAPFIPPQGVNSAKLRGAGGGGGGGAPTAAASGPGGAGGGAALQSDTEVACTPMTAYAITIGGGGAGSSSGGSGAAGSDTSVGSLATFSGASGGQGNGTGTNNSAGGLCIKNGASSSIYGVVSTTSLSAATANSFMSVAAGGFAPTGASGFAGAFNPIGGFSGGTGGTSTTGPRGGGGGGGAGPRGAGGNGGNAGTVTGLAGSNASANTGAGGGGSGLGGTSVQTAGNGGSGYVDIIYVL